MGCGLDLHMMPLLYHCFSVASFVNARSLNFPMMHDDVQWCTPTIMSMSKFYNVRTAVLHDTSSYVTREQLISHPSNLCDGPSIISADL
jgi:hypothetical protein